MQRTNLMRFSFAASIFVLAAIWFLWLTDMHPHFRLAPSAQSGVANWGQADGITKEILSGTSNSTDSTPSKTKKPSDRPLILYAFFETELSRRNFEFFLNHALHDGADFLFILNGETNAENIIPKRPNIRYIKRKNECYDMGAFAQVLVKDDFYKKYNKFITMNSSIRGPFFPLWSTQCWTDAYLNKVTDKVKLVGMTLACRPHVHVQSMIWATDRIGMETLLFPSPELAEKFKNDLPPHDNGNPVPPWQTPGINFCPDGYWNAVAVEVFATPLIRSAGYEIDVMMTAYHSMPEYEKTCAAWLNGDVLGPGHYYGMDIHPFDTIFQKTNRGSDPVTLEKMTVWTEERKYSSYDFCGK